MPDPVSELSLSIRVKLGDELRLGPGKIRLLELIGEKGSISEAGRAMAMSYRRAWGLVEELNRMLPAAVVLRQAGGAQGGRSELTPLGRELVVRYRTMEAAATAAATESVLPLLIGEVSQ